MSRKLAEADRAREQYAALAKLYQPIGPAAIVAALLCAAGKKNDEEQAQDTQTIKRAA